MRHYCTLDPNLFGQVRIHEKIMEYFKQNTTAHILKTGSNAYMEGCYLSKKVFNTFVRDANQISQNEYVWRPNSRAPYGKMFFTEFQFSDGLFFQVKIIQFGTQIEHFTDVSGMKFFFVFDNEDQTHLF